MLVGFVFAERELVDELSRVNLLWFQVPNVEVQQAQEKDGLEVVVPLSGLAFLRDSPSRVEDGPLHEVRLIGELHFDDERAAIPRVAVHVVSDFAFLLRQAELFALANVDVRDVQAEDGVEGTDDELFLSGILEDLLESEIDHRVDVENLLIVSHMFSVGPGMVCPSRGAKMRKETMQLSKIRIFNFRRFKE